MSPNNNTSMPHGAASSGGQSNNMAGASGTGSSGHEDSTNGQYPAASTGGQYPAVSASGQYLLPAMVNGGQYPPAPANGQYPAAATNGQYPAAPADPSVVNLMSQFHQQCHLNSTNGLPLPPLAPCYFTLDGQLHMASAYSPHSMPQPVSGLISDPAAFPFTRPSFSAAPSVPGGGYLSWPPGTVLPSRAMAADPANWPDVPPLDDRRTSSSTNESTPATPYIGSMSSRDGGIARVVDHDRSAYTTPSPQQVLAGAIPTQPKGFYPIAVPLDRDLDNLNRREPAIPKAVPAVLTPPENMKNLEQSLVNHTPGNRNVYIRGLHPTTDDALLARYASRFGEVETSKAIIDKSTGACKGFGFAKFVDPRDSETCIRGFFRLGYEVGFARVDDLSLLRQLSNLANRAQESFNSRLKAEGDETSTNLYLSNLPKQMTEQHLGGIFMGHTILSSKILRDSAGNSRGVGFARFESREVCDAIIATYNGTPVSAGLNSETLKIQIRYADTPAQKELKRITAERRQFRTNEYNMSAYGTPYVGSAPGNSQQVIMFHDRNAVRPRSQVQLRGLGRGQGGQVGQPASVVSNTGSSSEDGSCDEGVTVHVDSVSGADNGNRSSSPVKVKQEEE